MAFRHASEVLHGTVQYTYSRMVPVTNGWGGHAERLRVALNFVRTYAYNIIDGTQGCSGGGSEVHDFSGSHRK